MTDEPPCGQCGGIRIAGGESCLAHAKPAERVVALKQFSKTGELDVRGVTISNALLTEIFDAAPHDADGRQTFSAARFGGANFEDDAEFDRAKFEGAAEFKETKFGGDVCFYRATFKGDAMFDGAAVEGDAIFELATFEGENKFDGVEFGGDARFDQAIFDGETQFPEAAVPAGFRFIGFTSTADASRPRLLYRPGRPGSALARAGTGFTRSGPSDPQSRPGP